MATTFFSLLLLLLLVLSLSPPTSVQPKPLQTSPYLSPATVLFPDYQKMIATFRIYTYNPPKPFTFTTPSESLFHSSLLNSPFLTPNPNEAHLFFVPFPSDLSTRSLSRFVRDLRQSFPYWNRSLAADHFFVSGAGIAYSSDRNVLELKKNAVQISCFPTTSGNFIPHKDVTLPPLALPHAPPSPPPGNRTATFIGFMKWDEETQRQCQSLSQSYSTLVKEMEGDPNFLIESGPSDLGGGIRRSKFCLFPYGGDTSWIGEALRLGCVPAVITDRPIQDLPLMDVVRWSEIAVFVGTQGGARAVRAALSGIGGERYERMRVLGETAAQHFGWNAAPQPFDAFHMVMYQLWLRRHTIRYARWEWA